MYRHEHIEITATKFGGIEVAKEYEWVHVWLDEISRTGINIHKHRQYRHHEKALKNQLVPFIKELYPQADIELALNIARQHIIDDIGYVPKDEMDFI